MLHRTEFGFIHYHHQLPPLHAALLPASHRTAKLVGQVQPKGVLGRRYGLLGRMDGPADVDLTPTRCIGVTLKYEPTRTVLPYSRA